MIFAAPSSASRNASFGDDGVSEFQYPYTALPIASDAFGVT